MTSEIGRSARDTPHVVIHVITRLDQGGSAQNTMLTALGHDRSCFTPTVVGGSAGRWVAQGGDAATVENVSRLEAAGVRWVLIDSLTRSVHPIHDLHALYQLVQLFHRERPSIVHTHTSKAGVLGRLAAWMTRVPIVVHTPHGHVFYGHFGRLMSVMFLWIERLMAHVTTCMIALTEAERDEHLQRNVGKAERFDVIPSGIELATFRKRSEQRPGHSDPIQRPDGTVVIGTVGWLTPIKGHRFLIEALARLKPTYPHLYCVIVGSGPLHQTLESMAASLGLQESLRLMGHRDDIPACLSAIDIFAFPSLNEGMGRALIEAMAMGLPVIASRVGGIPALVEHGVNGLLVPSGDSTALSAAIAELLDQPNQARVMGDMARKRIDDTFSDTEMVCAIERVYHRVLAKPASS